METGNSIGFQIPSRQPKDFYKTEFDVSGWDNILGSFKLEYLWYPKDWNTKVQNSIYVGTNRLFFNTK